MANIDEAFTVDVLSLDDKTLIVAGIADPSIGAGFESPVGSLYTRTNGELYQKINTADVDWVRLSSNIESVMGDMFEPTGMTNRVDSTISFVDGTRTFAIQPAITSYTYYIKGVVYTITVPKQIAIPDVTGLHYVYLDSTETINTTPLFTYDLLSIYAYVGAVYWNVDTQTGVYVADERHGITMDGQTHIHLHTSFGTQYLSGLQLGAMIVDGDGSLDSHVQFDVSNGVIRDEDIQHDIVNNNPQQLVGIAQIPILYKFGTAGAWRIKPSDNFPLLQDGTAGFVGTGLPAYNQLVGNDWQLTEVTNNQYFFVHYLATNDIFNPVVGILGIDEYQNKPQGQESASIEFNQLTGLPFQEYVPLATVIFEARSVFTNTVKAAITSTSDGAEYINWTTETNTFDLGGSATNTDQLVKVSLNDTSAGFLNGKLVNGGSLTLTENNDGANETLTIDTTIPLADIQNEINAIETASGLIFKQADGTYDGTLVDSALSTVTASTDLLNALAQFDTAYANHVADSTIHFSTLGGLSDVIITGPIDLNSSISYNGTDWVNVPAVPPPPPGGSLQVQLKFGPIAAVSGTSQIPKDITEPQINEGTEIWTDTIDIQSAVSTINIASSVTLSASTSSLEIIFAIFRDAACIGVAVNSTANKSSGFALSFEIYDNPGAIGPHTYSVRVGKPAGVSGTWFINSIHANQPTNYFNGLLAQNSYKIAEIGTAT